MQLNIDELTKAGGFSGAPVERKIKWEMDGKEYDATVFVRRLSYNSAVADIFASATNKDGVAARIASSICDKDGNPVFSPDDITGEADPERGPLNHDLTMALLRVIGEVNQPGKQRRSRKKK